jgi:cytochrome P450
VQLRLVTAMQPKYWMDPDELPVFTDDRQRYWEALRNRGPVVLMKGIYGLTRRDDVLMALHKPDVFVLRGKGPDAPVTFARPEHKRWHRKLLLLLDSDAVEEIRPRLREQAAALVDAVAASGGCEAMADVAEPFAAQVLLTLLGLPLDARDRLIVWKDSHAAILEAHVQALQGARFSEDLTPKYEMTIYLRRAIDERRKHPDRPGLLSKLLVGDDPLDDGETIAIVELIFAAGAEPLKAAIGSVLLELSRNPQLCSGLRGNSQQIRRFVDDILQREPPAPITTRITTEEVTVAGVTLPAGSRVELWLQALSQDNETPVRDGGSRRGNWVFGAGPNRCVAAFLVKSALCVLVGEWLHRIPTFELDADTVPPLVASVAVKLSSLPLRWGPKSTKILPPHPCWRFWFRKGDLLISPFEGEIAEGPLIAGREGNRGIHCAPTAEGLFEHSLLRFALHPESVVLSSLTDAERGAWEAVRKASWAVTFGAELGNCNVDPHPYRITAVMWDSRTVDRLVVDGWSEALRARYGCAVIPEVTLKRCRHLEATMGPRLDYLAHQPLPRAGVRGAGAPPADTVKMIRREGVQL